MGHARKRMYNELPEPPTGTHRRTRHRPQTQLEGSQQQRDAARGRLGELFRWQSPTNG
ncbi:hypothetical protein ACPXB3_00365 [Gordonia sp. DT219]|uniref:hypothetical protein n=1 Tax=Gordonia sp. DT219 TaxID=3416658 RepID=UPI003CFAA2F5